MRSKSQKLEALKRVPLFEGLSGAELKYILGETQEVMYSPGQTIVAEGQPGGRFYLIAEGQAKVTVGGRKRRNLGPGDYFGEMSLLAGGARTATVTAESHVKALAIASWNFLALMEEHFSMTRKIMGHLCRRISTLERATTG